MKTMTISEVRAHWYQLLKEVKAGERIIVTRHGVPVRELVPPDEPVEPTAVTPKEELDDSGREA